MSSSMDQQNQIGTVAARFYDYRKVFPQLELLKQHQATLLQELQSIYHTEDWFDWPETHLYGDDVEWNVFPFLAFGLKVDRMCELCPETARILQSLPGIRIAVYSRLGAKSELEPHCGLAPMANDALRCHFGLIVPQNCGIWVEGEIQEQRAGEIIVFDDSKEHSAYNKSSEERVVLLMDLQRPADIPRGNSLLGLNQEMNGLIEKLSPFASPFKPIE